MESANVQDAADHPMERRRPPDIASPYPNDHRISGQHDETSAQDDNHHPRSVGADGIALPYRGHLENTRTVDYRATPIRDIRDSASDVESISVAHASDVMLADDQQSVSTSISWRRGCPCEEAEHSAEACLSDEVHSYGGFNLDRPENDLANNIQCDAPISSLLSRPTSTTMGELANNGQECAPTSALLVRPFAVAQSAHTSEILTQLPDQVEASSLTGEEDARVHTKEDTNTAHPTWSSMILRPRTFYAFAAVYGIFIVLLVVMLAIDATNQGLVTVDHDLHYIWTYGPTLRKLSDTAQQSSRNS